MLRLCDVQFHLRWRNWFSHSRKPRLMPFVIFFSSEVLLRLSCRQISAILFGIFCVFLHTFMGSSKMLLPSALLKKNDCVVTNLLTFGADFTPEIGFSAIAKLLIDDRLITSDTIFYITQRPKRFFTIFLLHIDDDTCTGNRWKRMLSECDL